MTIEHPIPSNPVLREATSSRGPIVDAHGSTHQGLVRDRNEDAFLIARLEHALVVQSTSLPLSAQPVLSSGAGGSLFVVADGMGGQGGGDIASRVGIASVVEYLLARMPWSTQTDTWQAPESGSIPGVRNTLDDAVHAGDAQVKQAGAVATHPEMGTTLTLAYVPWPRLYIAHAGDSRCYVHRGGTLFRLTRDHNLAEQLRARSGEAVPEDSPLHNVVWNSLGAGAEVKPEIERHLLVPGDVLLLCTDGLGKHVSDEEVSRILGGTRSAEAWCQKLVDAAIAGGGTDNVTVVVARFDPPSAPQSS